MSFTWIYPSAEGDYIQSEEIVEIRDNMETIKTAILDPTPASTETVSFIQPLADGVVARDDVGDELQVNLDTLKAENYCRGHYTTEHNSNNISDHVAVHATECGSNLPSGCASDHATYHASKFLDNKITNDSANYGTNF